MLIALDPYTLRDSMTLSQILEMAKRIGFKAIEISPRDDFLPWWSAPRVWKSRIAEVKQEVQASGLTIASVLGSYRWCSTDESERATAIRYWTQAIRATASIGADRMSSEMQGDPSRPAESEAAFWRSLDDIIPVLEKEGVKMAFEAHPNDFIEDGFAAVDLIRSIDHPLISYVLCAPHTFSLLGAPTQLGMPGATVAAEDVARLIRHSAPVMTEVHIADTLDPARVIINPPGAPVRVHQHLDIGLGDIDWDVYLGTLREVGFDGIFTVAIFSHPDRPVESYEANLARLTQGLAAAGYPTGEG